MGTIAFPPRMSGRAEGRVAVAESPELRARQHPTSTNTDAARATRLPVSEAERGRTGGFRFALAPTAGAAGQGRGISDAKNDWSRRSVDSPPSRTLADWFDFMEHH